MALYITSIVVIVRFILFIALISACGGSSSISVPDNHNELQVLCTTAQVASLVKGVLGDRGKLTILIQGESDPHSYQLVKGDDEKFRRSNIVFYSGLGLEHSPAVLRLIEKTRKLSIGDAIAHHQKEAIINLSGTPDPHIWMDISLWKLALVDIASVLSEIKPEFENEFKARAEQMKSSLEDTHNKILALCQSISPAQRYLVTTHDAFNYFTRAYLATEEERLLNSWQDRCFAPEGLAPESQISTQDIEKTVHHIIQYGVHSIFAESNVSQDSIHRVIEVLKRKGVEVEIAQDALFADAMGKPGAIAGDYESMMMYNAETIHKYLSK